MEVTLMTNKEKLKNAIEQDINPKDYYTEIIMRNQVLYVNKYTCLNRHNGGTQQRI